ncbi:hypothetical protein CWI75_08300 [Kineobactrum sediminis]|uniref:Uncharacterized protein n=1 Tax=Kineobactrum sediminis TaxID=1905677 RepID=A0A2N5Y2G6_9GAMM|nr:hypothetical protein [Kineobactrum sediminis]PLW82577.1 hypothetical protein CWI75_08300 [Kineobactrum sediminis]
MAWTKWLPWRFAIRRLARSHGFLDPIALLARMHRFAQPSEVAEPVELLRAGVVFHARGLINSRVIQHNLDWVWPYWIERQFDPLDDAFIPRAFSITHINLTHRNWTAIGLPDLDFLPIVDDRGLLTPHYDGWSIDTWVLGDDGSYLLPSRVKEVSQQWQLDEGLSVNTSSAANGLQLVSRAEVDVDPGEFSCHLQLTANSEQGGWLVVALRPYNPEGVAFINQAELSAERKGWCIEGDRRVNFSAPAERHHVSDYRAGDVSIYLKDKTDETRGLCDVGMVTAAALFRLEPGEERKLRVSVPLAERSTPCKKSALAWEDALKGVCQIQVPDGKMQFLFNAALRTLVLHSPGDVYPGPYTYKRFWFRDAAFIINALLCAGFTSRAERALDQFAPRQTLAGYYHSQEGEWDANGQALWIMQRYCAMTGTTPKPEWHQPILRGARWIGRKRAPQEHGSPTSGLLPAGFSAEHLGLNDYYYWDDFWGVAGLRAASHLCHAMGQGVAGETFEAEGAAFQADIDASLALAALRLERPMMPAAPSRRPDPGAIGSLAMGYPAQLTEPHDVRLMDTVDFLLDNCMVSGGFFQDMIHAGINPYLTLHIAQVLLRAGDQRYFQLVETVADLASPTGQWPEAIHPRTGGGCMGDGQHTWAAAEWVLMLRNMFLREEGHRLLLCQGIPDAWLIPGVVSRIGPAPTEFGTVTVEIVATEQVVRIAWEADWHQAPPHIEVHLPGYAAVTVPLDETYIELKKHER